MVAIWVLLFAANVPGARSDTANQVAAIEARMGGRIGIAALDTGSGKGLNYRAEERFPMCSTFKFLAAAAVLKRVDEKRDQLDRFVSYDAKDILEYAPGHQGPSQRRRDDFGCVVRSCDRTER